MEPYPSCHVSIPTRLHFFWGSFDQSRERHHSPRHIRSVSQLQRPSKSEGLPLKIGRNCRKRRRSSPSKHSGAILLVSGKVTINNNWNTTETQTKTYKKQQTTEKRTSTNLNQHQTLIPKYHFLPSPPKKSQVLPQRSHSLPSPQHPSIDPSTKPHPRFFDPSGFCIPRSLLLGKDFFHQGPKETDRKKYSGPKIGTPYKDPLKEIDVGAIWVDWLWFLVVYHVP